MTKNKIISILRQPQIKQQLMDAGMTHLRLFGSYARDEATDDSDIDLLYTYDTSKHKVWSRWPYGKFEYLKERLGKDVDLVSKDYIDDLIKDNVLSSSVSIY